MGFFSLVFLFHLQPELPLTNYSCGVTSRSRGSICLRGQAQHATVCTSVCECVREVCIQKIMQAGVLCETMRGAAVCVRV